MARVGISTTEIQHPLWMRRSFTGAPHPHHLLCKLAIGNHVLCGLAPKARLSGALACFALAALFEALSPFGRPGALARFGTFASLALLGLRATNCSPFSVHLFETLSQPRVLLIELRLLSSACALSTKTVR